MSTPKPRFRFAPSPTGYLHIGGARTALYNYLMAKKLGGDFVLRIEDTDLERSSDESIQAILDGMTWLGLKWDEGPHYQTKRFDLYHEKIQKLIDEKKAYPCFCTPEELTQKRELAQKEKRKPIYDRTCLKLSKEEVQKNLDEQKTHCIRFHSPDEGETLIDDIVKGKVIVQNKELDDLIIRRSDGSPTYNFTVVIDDVTMNITHVIRGDDHLNNTPRQIQLYEALGYPLPKFAHLPMILGSDKKRLSKRHGATSVMAYKEMGYLPEALLNYLVRLGWSYKDQEVFTMDEMIQAFTLEAVSGAAGVFNPDKLLWLNGVYIREADPKYLTELVKPFLEEKGLTNLDESIVIKAIAASQEKVKTINEFVEMIDLFFVEYDAEEKMLKKLFNDEGKNRVTEIAQKLEDQKDWSVEALKKLFNQIMEEKGLGLGKLASPIRLALSGKKISPGVFDMLHIMGKEKSLKRIRKYL